MGVPSKRIAVFLCLIILHQDLVIARSHYDLELITSPRLTTPVETADDYLLSNQTMTSNELTLSSSRALGREKRLFGLVLFIVSIVVTAVATTIETIYDIHGCCGLGFDYLCSFEANFKRKQCEIKDRAEKVDKRLQEAVKKKDKLECLSKVVEGFWTEISRLVNLQQEFIELIAPGLKDSLMRKQNKIQIVIRDAKRDLTEDDLRDFEHELQQGELALKLSIGWSSAALPGFALLGRTTWKAFKFNQLYQTLKSTQLETLLKASPRGKELVGFTRTSAKGFIKGIAKTRFAAKTTTLTKGMKIVKYGGWVMSLFSIAMDIFSTVCILMGCDNKVDEAKKAMATLQEPEKNVTAMETKIKEYEDAIKTEMEDKIVAELRKADLHNALEQVKLTIKNLPTGQRTWLTEDCVDSIIPNALKTFSTSNNYVVLKDDLKYVIENCVSPLKYAYECLISRTKVRNSVLESCLIGAGEFDEIYGSALQKEGTKKEQCIKDGEPYTPENDYLKSLEEFSRRDGFSIPCRLNSEPFKDDVCDKKRRGKSPKEIAKSVNMNVTDVQKVLEKCKLGEDYFSAVQISRVCTMKSFCDDLEIIAEDFEDEFRKSISIEKIKTMPCPDEKKNDDCPILYD
ncbi:uncharacterized protein LOC116300186 [Actinia tenebrosa]|uniref:Uncharacterized protein LOC116300186 n=1 Tax=Actinia tenebrosa TaxID=6105 RepID=A0A6P8I8H0_ACTTE|nr:uncharacterized protein LOC116300186 [Actinia tenebrosa]